MVNKQIQIPVPLAHGRLISRTLVPHEFGQLEVLPALDQVQSEDSVSRLKPPNQFLQRTEIHFPQLCQLQISSFNFVKHLSFSSLNRDICQQQKQSYTACTQQQVIPIVTLQVIFRRGLLVCAQAGFQLVILCLGFLGAEITRVHYYAGLKYFFRLQYKILCS